MAAIERIATMSPTAVAIPAPVLQHPPKLVYDDRGQQVEVILTYEDYRAFLRVLAKHADWGQLPRYLQDAIDVVLIDEVRAEKGQARPLRQLLAETEELTA